jgi:hypothetical protein
LLRNDNERSCYTTATGKNATIPRQNVDTKIIGRDVFYTVRAEIYAGQVRS